MIDVTESTSPLLYDVRERTAPVAVLPYCAVTRQSAAMAAIRLDAAAAVYTCSTHSTYTRPMYTVTPLLWTNSGLVTSWENI